MSLTGYETNLLWCLPFAGTLLSLAVLPSLAPRFWHDHFHWVSLFWTLAFVVPFAALYGMPDMGDKLLHTAVKEYIPFLALAGGLYVVSGGIRLTGSLMGTPLTNVGILSVGAMLASFIGTTGASMLLVRPLMRANEHRTHAIHTYIFFIFLVSNIGGGLTPIGDPPLFLGLLQGVPFFWSVEWMWQPVSLMALMLLAIYLCLELFYYPREKETARPVQPASLGLEGGLNFIPLGVIVGAVVLSGVFPTTDGLHLGHDVYAWSALLRDGVILLAAFLSWKLTPKALHEANNFSWLPVKEIATLFAAILICIAPVMETLAAGKDGALAIIPALLTSADGEPSPMAYFWLTGILSAFLDNAPTYLVFFQAAGGDAAHLTGPWAHILLAISMGSVFMGALTYVGNAPNLMVLSIARHRGIRMPGFFGYIVWSSIILLPLFALISWLFFG